MEPELSKTIAMALDSPVFEEAETFGAPISTHDSSRKTAKSMLIYLFTKYPLLFTPNTLG
jgi:hypothetical protein